MNISSGDLTDEEQLLKQLEHFMYGHNYQVSFGLLPLKSATSIDKAKAELKKNFTGANVDKLILSNLNDFWEEINRALDYRGDDSSGLKLTKDNEKMVYESQRNYRHLIKKYLEPDSSIYNMVSFEGIPGYPVYWGFCFIIVNRSGQSIFLYGSSSD